MVFERMELEFFSLKKGTKKEASGVEPLPY